MHLLFQSTPEKTEQIGETENELFALEWVARDTATRFSIEEHNHKQIYQEID